MENHRDEPIACADCGASFVFSADEAAVFAERGLAAPKRCKDCRRARKERAASGGQGGAGPRGFGGGHAPADRGGRGPIDNGNTLPRAAAPRFGAQPRRYTGDVNEYRSPMQDGFSATPYATAPRAASAWRSPGEYRSGEYRSPMTNGFTRPGTDAGPRGPRGPRPARDDGNFRAGPKPRPAFGGGVARERPPVRADAHAGFGGAVLTAAHDAPAASKPARRRPQGEMFAITCDTCGAQAEVPFKPAEGREVYCPTCYRARRPSPP